MKYHNKRIAITREFTFDAAHKLDAYEGKCAALHGHTYKLVITVSSRTAVNGIGIDFGNIKQLFERKIESRLDHAYLNEALPQMNTTAENMIVWIWEQLEEDFSSYTALGTRLEALTLYETPTSYVSINREWMMENEQA